MQNYVKPSATLAKNYQYNEFIDKVIKKYFVKTRVLDDGTEVLVCDKDGNPVYYKTKAYKKYLQQRHTHEIVQNVLRCRAKIEYETAHYGEPDDISVSELGYWTEQLKKQL